MSSMTTVCWSRKNFQALPVVTTPNNDSIAWTLAD
jgi:hypothetical protein